MNPEILPYSNTLISLLQGILYLEDKEWFNLKKYKSEIEDYFSKLGLELYYEEFEGYAFLKQKDFGEDESLKQLVSKRQLSFPNTVLLVLLREELTKFDLSTSEQGRLVISKEEILDMMKIFYKNAPNEVKTSDKIETSINKLVEYGFLKWENDKKNRLEIKRIIKAVIDADKLNEIKTKLLEYAERI